MKKTVILYLKGLIIGLGQIVPGVSGAMLAIFLGLYEKGVEAISNFFTNIKANLKFLIPIGLGIVTSVLFISKLIKISLDNFYVPTMLLFIGLILGSVPPLFEKTKRETKKYNIIIFLVVFIGISAISLLNLENKVVINNFNVIQYLMFALVGFIYAATMVIPGVSGTAIMMLIGYYNIVITMISSLTSIDYIFSHLGIIFPFAFGFVIGVIIISKMMNYLLKKHETKTYYGIIGLVCSSILIMIVKTFNVNFDVFTLVTGLILFLIGFYISKKLENI